MSRSFSIYGIWCRKNIRGIASAILLVAVVLTCRNLAYAEQQLNPQDLFVFHSSSCHNCIEVKEKVLPILEDRFKGKIRIVYFDIGEVENYKILIGLKEKYRRDLNIVLPVFYLNGHLLNGKGINEKMLEAFIRDSLSGPLSYKRSSTAINLPEYFKSFRVLTIVGAGFIDGFNPCAFTVLVFFMSFLALQGYRRREAIAIGIFFIATVFVTYLLIGLGLFGFLYRLEGFRVFSRLVNIFIGILSVMLGIFAIYDFLRFKKSAKTDGLILQLPTVIKRQIHALIGSRYRNAGAKGGFSAKRGILGLALTSVITGFLVSILEAVCTGQTYLPTIAFVLKTSYNWQAIGYLVLYNILFIVPLFAIFVFALLGVTSEQFSGFLKRHLLPIKLLMAFLFLGLGLFLILNA